jgi:uncharacterized oligopeptide transporter (OPT) family protein
VVLRTLLLWRSVRCSSVRVNQAYRGESKSWQLTARLRRHQALIRERLRFPSGFSTAVLIGFLHSKGPQTRPGEAGIPTSGGFASLVPDESLPRRGNDYRTTPTGTEYSVLGHEIAESLDAEPPKSEGWAANMKLLLICFLFSGLFTLSEYFFPALRNIPVFGEVAAKSWLWTLNPSLAYVGQGVIMGSETSLHMLLGAVVGWAVLSPLAKYRGWAPGPVGDWETGSKGWIVWISLAIMLADSIISLGYISFQSVQSLVPRSFMTRIQGFHIFATLPRSAGYSQIRATAEQPLSPASPESTPLPIVSDRVRDEPIDEEEEEDAPPEQLISTQVVWIGLTASILLCIVTIWIVFGELVPLYAIVIAVAMALVLSIMGVRALGETDLNPVSGISKLAQLFFAVIIPQTNKSSVLINLVAGAVVCLELSSVCGETC